MTTFDNEVSIINIEHTNCDVPITFTVDLPGDETLYVQVDEHGLDLTLCSYVHVEGDEHSSIVEETEIGTITMSYEHIRDFFLDEE